MLPIRTRTIFKSRWMALLWAAGIIWFALDVATPGDSPANDGQSAQQTDAVGAPARAEDVRKIEQALRNL